VTNDKDFGERVYRSREPHAGVILLRLRRDVPRRRIAILRKLIADWGQRLQNKFTVATESKVRIRAR
jgi:predicted nuclease of predicted toxin-antitoxin system